MRSLESFGATNLTQANRAKSTTSHTLFTLSFRIFYTFKHFSLLGFYSFLHPIHQSTLIWSKMRRVPPTFFKMSLFETVSLPRKRFFGARPKCLRSSVHFYPTTKYLEFKMELCPQKGPTKSGTWADWFAIVLRETHVILWRNCVKYGFFSMISCLKSGYILTQISCLKAQCHRVSRHLRCSRSR